MLRRGRVCRLLTDRTDKAASGKYLVTCPRLVRTVRWPVRSHFGKPHLLPADYQAGKMKLSHLYPLLLS
jgi:hypothetical protein